MQRELYRVYDSGKAMRGKYRKGKGRDDGSKMKRRVVKACVRDVSVGSRCQTRVIHDYNFPRLQIQLH